MMTLLESLHLVHKVNSGSARAVITNCTTSRGTTIIFVCTSTAASVVVIDIPCPRGETEQRIAEHYGFRDLSHSLEFFKCCPECASGGLNNTTAAAAIINRSRTSAMIILAKAEVVSRPARSRRGASR